MEPLHTYLVKPKAWPPPRGEEGIHAALRYARLRDPIGHRFHLALALAHAFALPLSTAGSPITFGLLIGYAVLRLPRTWRCYPPLLRVPVLWGLATWALWMALSLSWSPDPAQGADELGTMRMILLPLALWPVLDGVAWIIGAALLGVAAQQIAQLLQATGLLNLRPQDPPGRFGGWIHPIQTGAWCTAAMCWYISAILTARDRLRWISLAGLAVATIGLLATESRGPWLAAAVVLPAMLVVMPLRRPGTWRAAVILVVVGVVGAAAAWPVAGHAVSERVQQAVEDYQAARDDGVYHTNIGLRVGQWRWTWDAFTDAPIVGVGAGGFRTAQAQQPVFQEAIQRWPKKADNMTRDHPHCTTLHVLATTGTIGGVIVLATIVLALLAAWRDRPDHPWAGGTFFLLIAWLIGAQFDCYNLNGHLLGLFTLSIALTLPHRAPVQPPYTDR